MLKYHQIASFIDEKSWILDVGSGEGQLGHILTLKGCLVDGLDINLDRLNDRKKYYQNIFLSDIREFKIKNSRYDYVVFSDMLEHVENPEAILNSSFKLLNSNGKVIISLPNVGYFLNRLGLLFGNWNYTEEGILDNTHLRFFTLETAKKLIQSSGYRICSVDPQIPIINTFWKRSMFNLFSKLWPSLFAIGWVFECVAEEP
jgi:2-polyprenyl-3-methyl-5-hydroxy-6-metoxy-1,4-benzoquinol methylase